MDKRFSYFPLNRHSNSHSYYGKEIYAIDETWRKLAKKKKKKTDNYTNWLIPYRRQRRDTEFVKRNHKISKAGKE